VRGTIVMITFRLSALNDVLQHAATKDLMFVLGHSLASHLVRHLEVEFFLEQLKCLSINVTPKMSPEELVELGIERTTKLHIKTQSLGEWHCQGREKAHSCSSERVQEEPVV
jgi:hypothetical protein